MQGARDFGVKGSGVADNEVRGNGVVPRTALIEAPACLHHRYARTMEVDMNDYAMMIGTTLAMLAASLAFVLLGYSLIGLLLFVFAVTPLPLQGTRWFAERMRGAPATGHRRR